MHLVVRRVLRPIKRTVAAEKTMTIIAKLLKLFAGRTDDHDYGAPRSPRWESLRREMIAQVKECVACGTARDLEVHHIIPFHLRKDLELAAANLIVLCRDCHLTFGHLKSWSSYNERVRIDAAEYRQKVKCRP